MRKSNSDWEALNELYQKQNEEQEGGITLKEFCEQNDLAYSTARKKIKTSRKAPKKIVENRGRKLDRAPNFKHGGYTKYFKAGINELAESTTLEDELNLCRARIHMVLEAMEGIQLLLDNPETKLEARSRLYESLFKAESALERNVIRTESITRTLSSIKSDPLIRAKLIAETTRIKQQTQALVNNTKRGKFQAEIAEYEAEKARKEAGGTSKLDDLIDKRTQGLDQVVSK